MYGSGPRLTTLAIGLVMIPSALLPAPDDYWGDKRRELAIETWEDVFGQEREGCFSGAVKIP